MGGDAQPAPLDATRAATKASDVVARMSHAIAELRLAADRVPAGAHDARHVMLRQADDLAALLDRHLAGDLALADADALATSVLASAKLNHARNTIAFELRFALIDLGVGCSTGVNALSGALLGEEKLRAIHAELTLSSPDYDAAALAVTLPDIDKSIPAIRDLARALECQSALVPWTLEKLRNAKIRAYALDNFLELLRFHAEEAAQLTMQTARTLKRAGEIASRLEEATDQHQSTLRLKHQAIDAYESVMTAAVAALEAQGDSKRAVRLALDRYIITERLRPEPQWII